MEKQYDNQDAIIARLEDLVLELRTENERLTEENSGLCAENEKLVEDLYDSKEQATGFHQRIVEQKNTIAQLTKERDAWRKYARSDMPFRSDKTEEDCIKELMEGNN